MSMCFNPFNVRFVMRCRCQNMHDFVMLVIYIVHHGTNNTSLLHRLYHPLIQPTILKELTTILCSSRVYSIAEWRKNTKTCPECRGDISKLSQPNVTMKNLANAFVVNCLFSRHDEDKSATSVCEWSGNIGDLEQHYFNDCPGFEIPCPNHCSNDETWPRGDIQHHLHECPLASVQCVNFPKCAWNGTPKALKSHLQECDAVTVTCASRRHNEKQCGRSQMSQTRFKDGDEESVCPWQGHRCDLQEHMRECEFALIPCPNGCKSSAKRSHL